MGSVLPQVMRHENSSVLELDGKEVSVFTPSKPREKWLRKRTHVKLRVRVVLGLPLQQEGVLSCRGVSILAARMALKAASVGTAVSVMAETGDRVALLVYISDYILPMQL